MEFEREVVRYEDQTKNKISGDMKAGIVIAGMVQVQLKEHLEINTAKLDTYAKVKDEIKEYLTAKKKWSSVIGADSSADMDLDALQQKQKWNKPWKDPKKDNKKGDGGGGKKGEKKAPGDPWIFAV